MKQDDTNEEYNEPASFLEEQQFVSEQFQQGPPEPAHHPFLQSEYGRKYQVKTQLQQQQFLTASQPVKYQNEVLRLLRHLPVFEWIRHEQDIINDLAPFKANYQYLIDDIEAECFTFWKEPEDTALNLGLMGIFQHIESYNLGNTGQNLLYKAMIEMYKYRGTILSHLHVLAKWHCLDKLKELQQLRSRVINTYEDLENEKKIHAHQAQDRERSTMRNQISTLKDSSSKKPFIAGKATLEQSKHWHVLQHRQQSGISRTRSISPSGNQKANQQWAGTDFKLKLMAGLYERLLQHLCFRILTISTQHYKYTVQVMDSVLKKQDCLLLNVVVAAWINYTKLNIEKKEIKFVTQDKMKHWKIKSILQL